MGLGEQMDWDNYIKLISAAFGVVGAGLVAYSTLSPECLVDLSKTHFDINPNLLDALVHEKASKITGFNFVGIAFIFTGASLFIPRNQRRKLWAYVLLFVVSTALSVVAVCVGAAIYQSNKEDAKKIVDEHYKNGKPEAIPSACKS